MLPPFIVAMYQMPISTTMPSKGGRMARPKAASFSPIGVPVSATGRVAAFSIFFSLTGSATTSATGWLVMLLPPKGASCRARSTGFSRPKSPLIVNALMILSLALRP